MAFNPTKRFPTPHVKETQIKTRAGKLSSPMTMTNPKLDDTPLVQVWGNVLAFLVATPECEYHSAI